ncbi:MAG: porin, partial [Marinobacter sp.]
LVTEYEDLQTIDLSTYGLDLSIGVVDVDWEEEAGKADVTEWYANVTYKFPAAKNVSVFAEIADNDLDDTDMGFLAGMRVKF